MAFLAILRMSRFGAAIDDRAAAYGADPRERASPETGLTCHPVIGGFGGGQAVFAGSLQAERYPDALPGVAVLPSPAGVFVRDRP